ncbi:MAG TPA: helix-turn-helix transcriptional regulator [Allocoleopsis sp.]
MTFTLKDLIKQKGLTQRELHRQTGIPEITVNLWVQGKRCPNLDNAVKLARALDINLSTLAKSMGIDVTGLIDDRSVSLKTHSQEEVITAIKTLVKSLDIDISSITD